jgi:benzoylformate decarboxylase
VNQLMRDFLEHRLSRRGFVAALTALGVSAVGARSMARAAQDIAQGRAPVTRRVTGTGGEILVEPMKAAGVRYVFTNPGSYEVGFFDALLDKEGVTLIVGLHEGLVVAMADGYNKVSQQPAFVNLHVIAGTAQASGQLYNSSRDNSAIVITAGLLDNENFNDDVVLGPRPSFNQKDVNRQFTKMSWESHHAGGIATMLRRAFKVATTEPGGPVYLALPNTILEQRGVTAEICDLRHFFIPSDIPPNPKRIGEVASLLLGAKAPALILGDEVSRANAQPEALELAELLGIPVHENPLPAFHNFPRHHTLFRGKFAAKGKDVILNLGDYDLGDYDVTERIVPVPEAPTYEPGARVVRMGLNTNAIGRNNFFDIAIVANVKLALRALLDALRATATAEQLRRLRAGRWDGKGWREIRPEAGRMGQKVIHPDELGWALEQELDRNAIVVSENLSGSNRFLSTGFRDNEKLWVSNSGAGLGWGVGAATGAKLAAPDRQVVCNIGDGSVMYSAAGFWTQKRYEVPVLTVVCNNLNYQTVRHAYCRYEGGRMLKENRFLGMYLGDPNIDFVKLAQSQCVEGVKVERSADLRPALRRGIKETRAGQPFLVEVVVQRTGAGADSTWHQPFSLAKQRRRNV